MFKVSELTSTELVRYSKRLFLNCPFMYSNKPIYPRRSEWPTDPKDWLNESIAAIMVVNDIEAVLDTERAKKREMDKRYFAFCVSARAQWLDYSDWCKERAMACDEAINRYVQLGLLEKTVSQSLIGGTDNVE